MHTIIIDCIVQSHMRREADITMRLGGCIGELYPQLADAAAGLLACAGVNQAPAVQ